MTEKKLTKPTVLTQMASRYGLGDQTFMNTLKATVMKADKSGKAPSNEEVAAFLLVANKYDLNPFTKEIYAFPDKRGGIVPVVGVDGHITLANRNPNYDGYEIEYSEEIVEIPDAKPCPEWCEIKVYRKDREHPIIVREYLDEVYQAPRSSFKGPWQSHTKRMLRHKALIQALRVAFGITGIYDEDEAVRIVETIDVPAGKPVIDEPVKKIDDSQGDTDTEPRKSQSNITQKQVARLIAIAKDNGYDVEDVEQYIDWEYQIKSKSEIPYDLYDEIVEHFEIQKGA